MSTATLDEPLQPLQRVPARSYGLHPGGQSTIRTEENAELICQAVASGMSIEEAATAMGIDSSTIRKWEDADQEFFTVLARARQKWADTWADKGLQMVLDEPRTETTKFGSKVDSGWVAWLNTKLNWIKWLMSKRNPAMYGDATSVTLSGSVTHVHVLSDQTRTKLASKKRQAQLKRLAGRTIDVPTSTEQAP